MGIGVTGPGTQANAFAVNQLRYLADAIERGEVRVDKCECHAGTEDVSSCYRPHATFVATGFNSLHVDYFVPPVAAKPSGEIKPPDRVVILGSVHTVEVIKIEGDCALCRWDGETKLGPYAKCQQWFGLNSLGVLSPYVPQQEAIVESIEAAAEKAARVQSRVSPKNETGKPFLLESRHPDGWIIARIVNPPFHEFLTAKGEWSGAGYVFGSREDAEVAMRLLPN